MDQQKTPLDELIEHAKDLKGNREALESALASCRRDSKSVVLQLIFHHGWSINKAAVLTGHMNPTIKVWVDRTIAEERVQARKERRAPLFSDTPE